MADGISADFSDFSKLAADLGEVVDGIGEFVPKAMKVTARNVQEDWRDNAKGMAHAPAFPASITFDIKGSASRSSSHIEAEIGPDKDRAQGSLGNLIEYGSVNNAPQGLGHGALQRNQDDFVSGLGKAEEDARKKGNL